ncbi:MAG: hypothetical protein AB4040_07725 [Synechococcus sp.]
MNHYLAVHWKSASKAHSVLELNENKLKDYCPAGVARVDKWHSASGQTCIYHLTQNQREDLLSKFWWHDEGAAIAITGFPWPKSSDSKALEAKEFFTRRCNQAASSLFGGEYSMVRGIEDSLQVESTLGGTHPIYMAETDSFVAITNRQSLLLAIPGISTEIDPSAMRWLCYQGYIQGGLSPFQRISMIQPGSRIIVRSGRASCESPTWQDYYAPELAQQARIEPIAAFKPLVEELSGYLAACQKHWGLGWDLPLSGGKDSRVVLGLLDAGGQVPNIEQSFTSGPLYSPDVISAQRLSAFTGLYDRHKLRRPPLVPPQTTLIGRVTTALRLTEGRLSAFDLVGLPQAIPRIHVTGHQNGLRDSYFRNCSTSSFQHFACDVLKAHFHDPLELLSHNPGTDFKQQYIKIFEKYLDEGAPLDVLSDLYMVRERNAHWVGIMSNQAGLGGPTANPLVTDSVIRSGLSLTPEQRNQELLHYALLRLSAPQLTGIPFADDQWTHELRESMRPIDNVPDVAPFRSRAEFPNVSNPYLPNHKVDLYNAVRPLILRDILHNKDYYGEFLDLDRAEKVFRSSKAPNMNELICGLGVFTSVLLRRYGASLFTAEGCKSATDELTEEAAYSPSKAGDSSHAALERHRESLVRLEDRLESDFGARLAVQRAFKLAEIGSDVALESMIADCVVERQRFEGSESVFDSRAKLSIRELLVRARSKGFVRTCTSSIRHVAKALFFCLKR